MPPIKAGLIGLPLTKSLSPQLFSILAGLCGREIEYSLWECGTAKFHEAAAKARESGWTGFNATLPDKQLLAGTLADKRDRAAEISGSANCARFIPEGLEARNTDAAAMAAAMLDRGMDLTGKKAAVFGSGGSAATSAYVLASAGAEDVTFYARDPLRAGPAIGRLSAAFPGAIFSVAPFGPPDGAAAVVNATPIGMYEEGHLPVEPAKDQICVDWPYSPGGTFFTRRAKELGAHVIDGMELLVRQAVLSLFLWGGCRESDIADLIREGRKLLREKAGG
jgi:shikimate dehydrogenase